LEKHEIIFQNVSNMIISTDKSGQILDANNRVEDILGYKPKEIIEKNFVQEGILIKEDIPRFAEHLKNVIRSKKTADSIELTLIHKTGSLVSVEVYSRLIVENGLTEAVVNILRDTSKIKLYEKALEENKEKKEKSENQYHSILDSFFDIYYKTNNLGEVILVSPSVFFQAGYRPEDIIGHSVSDFFLFQEDREVFEKKLHKHGYVNDYELKLRTKDQITIDVSVSCRIYSEEDGLSQGVEGILRNISQRKDAERSMKESKELYKSLLQASPNAILVINLEGNITYVSKEAVKLLGFKDYEEMLGLSFFDLIVEKEHGKIISTLQRLFEGDIIQNKEHTIIRKDESQFTGEICSSVIKNSKGIQSGYISIIRDITAEREDEKKFREIEKFAALGELSAGIAHEINNPLNIISGYSQMLLENIDLNSEFRKKLTSIHTQTERASQIIDKLFSYSTRAKPKRNKIDINETIKDVLLFLKLQLDLADIRVKINLSPVVFIHADKFQIEQVFDNIITNSIHAISNKGTITIKTSINGDTAEIVFTDSGTGIAENDLSKIFEPFYSGRKKGTGLGLSIVRKIVLAHNGNINIESTLGKGTTVTITLPVI